MSKELNIIKATFEKEETISTLLDIAEYLSPDQFSQMFDIVYDSEDNELNKKFKTRVENS